MKTSLIEKKCHIRAGSLNAAEAEMKVDSHDADRSDLYRSRNAVQLSGYAPMRKARTVLVPMDFTESSHKALDYALQLADCIGASIVLLHVVGRIYAEGFLDTPARFNVRTEADRRAREKLDAVAESKSDRLVPISRVVGHGVPEHEILRLVESMDVDLIVLGRSPRNPLSRLVFGSVTRAVVDTAPCPVLVVAGKTSPLRQ